MQVYAVYFKCNKRLIREYPNLRNYTAEIYQMPGNGIACYTHLSQQACFHMCQHETEHANMTSLLFHILHCAPTYTCISHHITFTPVLLRHRALTCMLCCPMLSVAASDTHQHCLHADSRTMPFCFKNAASAYFHNLNDVKTLCSMFDAMLWQPFVLVCRD